MSDEQRRYEDRDRYLHARLDQMEKSHQDLTRTVTGLDNSVGVLKLEQTHLKEFFQARLSVIEKSGELQIHKIDEVLKDLHLMGSDAEKSPMGRQLSGQMRSSVVNIDECKDKIDRMNLWQTKVEGVLLVLKWMGAGGLVSLGIWVLRLLQIIP